LTATTDDGIMSPANLLAGRPDVSAFLRCWLPEIVFLAVTTFVGVWGRGRWLNPIGDAGIWWSLIGRLSAGELLYRDVFLQYGPLSPYLLALGARLFGPSATYIILANWVAAILCGFLLLRIARRLLPEPERLALVGLMLSLSIFGRGSGPLVLPYAPAAVHALALSLVALLLHDEGEKQAGGWSVLVGLLAGLAFDAKQEIGLAALLALCVSVFLRPPRWARLGRVLVGFLAAVVLGLGYVLIVAPDHVSWRRSHLWPLASGASKPWRDLFATVMGVSGPDWALLVRGSLWTLLVLSLVLGVGGLLVARERERRPWLFVACLAALVGVWWLVEGFQLVGRFWPACLSMLVSLSLVLWSLVDRRSPSDRRAFLLSIALFAVINGTRTAFSADLGSPYAKVSQLPASLSWVVFTCVLLPGVLASSAKAANCIRTAGLAALLFVSWRAALTGIPNLAPRGVEPLQTERGTIYVTPNQKALLSAIQARVRPRETALVLPEINGVDVLFGVRNVSPWLSHVPGWLDADAERVLLGRLREKPPDLVIFFRRPNWEFRVGPFGMGYGFGLARWIAENYRPDGILPEGTMLRPISSERARISYNGSSL
jgi:4-amino-4-deoxy-L-arabinose transferase-like glycosyltransferase